MLLLLPVLCGISFLSELGFAPGFLMPADHAFHVGWVEERNPTFNPTGLNPTYAAELGFAPGFLMSADHAFLVVQSHGS